MKGFLQIKKADATKIDWSNVIKEMTLEAGDANDNPIYAMHRSNDEGAIERTIIIKE